MILDSCNEQYRGSASTLISLIEGAATRLVTTVTHASLGSDLSHFTFLRRLLQKNCAHNTLLCACASLNICHYVNARAVYSRVI